MVEAAAPPARCDSGSGSRAGRNLIVSFQKTRVNAEGRSFSSFLGDRYQQLKSVLFSRG